MKVLICDSVSDQIIKIERPAPLGNPGTPVIAVFDQSSSCTALTVGDLKGNMLLNITFERDKSQRNFETVEDFLEQVGEWLKVILSNVQIIDWALERFVGTKWQKSDAVTKQVRGKILSLYRSLHCLDSDGKAKPLSRVAEVTEIPNTEWKSVIVPIDYFRAYKDHKLAVQAFVSKLFPLVHMMPQDISDSICMYMYLIKTKHGNAKLYPTKSNLNVEHNLVMMAIPFNDISNLHEDILALGLQNDKSSTGEVATFKSQYRKSAIARVLNLMNGKHYVDDYIKNSLQEIDNNFGIYLSDKEEGDIKEIVTEASYFSLHEDITKYKEIEFNEKMSAEDNMRCFTWKDKQIYFSIVEKNQHFCYLIPMFNLKLSHNQKIAIIATKY